MATPNNSVESIEMEYEDEPEINFRSSSPIQDQPSTSAPMRPEYFRYSPLSPIQQWDEDSTLSNYTNFDRQELIDIANMEIVSDIPTTDNSAEHDREAYESFYEEPPTPPSLTEITDENEPANDIIEIGRASCRERV